MDGGEQWLFSDRKVDMNRRRFTREERIAVERICKGLVELSPEETEIAKAKRNDPCPCGSSKKHKKCCLGRIEAAMADIRKIGKVVLT